MNHSQSDYAVKLGIPDTCLKLGGINLGNMFYELSNKCLRSKDKVLTVRHNKNSSMSGSSNQDTKNLSKGNWITQISPRDSYATQRVSHVSHLWLADTYYSVHTISSVRGPWYKIFVPIIERFRWATSMWKRQKDPQVSPFCRMNLGI